MWLMGDIFFSSTLPTGRPPYSPGTQKEQTIQIDAPQIRRTPKDCFKKKKSMTLATQNPVLCICVYVLCFPVILSFLFYHIVCQSVNYQWTILPGGGRGGQVEKERKREDHKGESCQKPTIINIKHVGSGSNVTCKNQGRKEFAVIREN